jgi:S-adenosylmethionine hydrolase
MGRALVAQISTNQFFVTAAYGTVDFKAASGRHRDFLRVEEAEPLGGKPNSSRHGKDYSAASAFRVMRILNGDETDHSLPFSSAPETLRVALGTY